LLERVVFLGGYPASIAKDLRIQGYPLSGWPDLFNWYSDFGKNQPEDPPGVVTLFAGWRGTAPGSRRTSHLIQIRSLHPAEPGPGWPCRFR
jgi:hypothetical protein